MRFIRFSRHFLNVADIYLTAGDFRYASNMTYCIQAKERHPRGDRDSTDEFAAANYAL